MHLKAHYIFHNLYKRRKWLYKIENFPLIFAAHTITVCVCVECEHIHTCGCVRVPHFLNFVLTWRSRTADSMFACKRGNIISL